MKVILWRKNDRPNELDYFRMPPHIFARICEQLNDDHLGLIRGSFFRLERNGFVEFGPFLKWHYEEDENKE